jgi:selenide,water dikinase
MVDNPSIKEIVLVGGGHSHVLFLAKWAKQPIAGLQVTLVSPQVMTPYSGMLPGLVAGHYQFDQCHIDLIRLCRFAGARFLRQKASGLQPDNNQLMLSDSHVINYDVISFDSGATPDLSVKGAAEFAIAVKPVDRFYQRWTKTVAALNRDNKPATYISVVGNGAGGIELLLAMHTRLSQLRSGQSIHYQLVARSEQILSGYPKRLQTKLLALLKSKHIHFVPNFEVSEVTDKQLFSSKQQNLRSDLTFWCTQVKGGNWLTETHLPLSEQGFIRVKSNLQSIAFNNVFASGDVCHFEAQPLAKAGVFAVRMADILFDNITALARNQPLVNYQPQTAFLSLLACGDKTALGTRFGLTFSGHWVWRWKDAIDRKFMSMVSL